MAIDMLENNEMGALAPSRLGLQNFIDDVPIRGKRMPNKEERFEELFGTKRRKRSKAAQADLKTRLSELPKDCASINQSIAILEEGVATNIKLTAAGAKAAELKRLKNVIAIYQSALGEYKKIRASSCAAELAASKAKEQADFEQKLVNLSEASVEKAKAEAETITQKVASNKKLLLIGGGVIALGIIGYVIFGRK